MGVFQKIRDNSLLTLILVGGSLFLFIIGDSLTSGSLFQDNVEQYVGTIEGEEISLEEWNAAYRTMVAMNRQSQGEMTDREEQNFANQTWTQLLSERILTEEGNQLGIDITQEEVEEMLSGENVLPFYVYRLFGGPQAFQQNRSKIAQNPDEYYKYANVGGLGNAEVIKNYGITLRKQEKIFNLMNKAFFPTKSLAKDAYSRKNTKKSVKLLQVPYYAVDDSTLTATDKEIEAYYNKNKKQFKQQQPQKKIVYAAFRLEPSDEDDLETIDWAQQTVELFKKETNDRLFIKQESELPYDDTYYKKDGGLEKQLDTILFKKEKGFVFGPYVKYREGDKTLNVAKVLDVQMMADSVSVSHIQISPENYLQGLMAGGQPTQEQINAAWKKYEDAVDSAFNALKNGASFAKVAKDMSADTVSGNKGGDMGFVQRSATNILPKNAMDSIFINAPEGSLKKVRVELQRGYYYYEILKVDKVGPKAKRIQVGVVSRAVVPGSKTLDNYYNKANQLAVELQENADFESLRDSLGYYIDSAMINQTVYVLNDLSNARKVVTWAFDSETDLNEPNVFELDEKYIVAMVTENQGGDYRPLDKALRGQIKRQLTKEKKFKHIAEKLADPSAETFTKASEVFTGATVESFNDVNGQNGIASYSFENALTGAVAGVQQGGVSKWVQGSDAAYLVMASEVSPAVIDENTNLEPELNAVSGDAPRFDYLLFEVINNKADIEDNRRIIE
jgi:peptidyl-prolyl cis-trans isomerase D